MCNVLRVRLTVHRFYIYSEPLRRVKTAIESPLSGSSDSFPNLFASQVSTSDDFYQVKEEHERKTLLLNSMKTYKREVYFFI